MKNNFWQTLSLKEMTKAQWESLCDGCGRCCLHKIEDEDSNEIYFSNVVCRYIDEETCRCTHYKTRQSLVPDCLSIYPDWAEKFRWLPPTCAYRLLSEGKDLFVWHPLISGSVDSVHLAGISVRGRTFKDDEIDPNDIHKHIITWVD
ncbi:MAG: YcgN family cysteine cluster protein [Candidatus Thioglobus sp.]|nr:MAG: YcgN family cysteine cluster protein [Candidatus Thioglobus sp.]KAA0446492.1 MAG: YcgN family cysteine cluster protein [Candidatus Thioglobus sp.]